MLATARPSCWITARYSSKVAGFTVRTPPAFGTLVGSNLVRISLRSLVLENWTPWAISWNCNILIHFRMLACQMKVILQSLPTIGCHDNVPRFIKKVQITKLYLNTYHLVKHSETGSADSEIIGLLGFILKKRINTSKIYSSSGKSASGLNNTAKQHLQLTTTFSSTSTITVDGNTTLSSSPILSSSSVLLIVYTSPHSRSSSTISLQNH